ncbi:hypothetical protein [Pandoraea oxalativorans]|nr:hypothetical protein [Pandoraea oxalativorans]
MFTSMNVGGYKSIYQKQDPNDEASSIGCTNTAHLYFHDGDSSTEEKIQKADSCKINPGFYSLNVDSDVATAKIAETIEGNIKSFLKKNPECKCVNVKFHSFDNDSPARVSAIKEIVIKKFADTDIEIKPADKKISYKSLNNSRFRNRMIRYVGELNKKNNLRYEDEFLTSNGANRKAGNFKNLCEENRKIYKIYQDVLSKEIEGMRQRIEEDGSIAYIYEGKDLSGALNKLIAHDPFVLDCTLFVNLCMTLSLRDELGDERLNELLSSKLGGKFSLDASDVNKLLEEIGLKIAVKSVNQMNKGDILYIEAVNARVFHPTATMNSHNLVCIGKNPAADHQLMFQGFERMEPSTLADLKEFIVTLAKCNLTYADLLTMHSNSKFDDVLEGEEFSCKQAWEEIVNKNGREVVSNELDFIKDRDMRGIYDDSRIEMPDVLIFPDMNVVGVMEI